MIYRKVSNRETSAYVRELKEFDSHNGTLWGRWEDIGTGETDRMRKALYVVYSYGKHHPLYVHERSTGKWYRNMEKYSSTTSRHLTQAHPGVPCEDIATSEEMMALAEGGVLHLIEEREWQRKRVEYIETAQSNARAFAQSMQQIKDALIPIK